ncbi:MAG: hypothetical protein WCH43_09525 [Verrucomicrobiota bacterium]
MKMRPRSEYQVMGFWFKEPTIIDPETARPKIKRLAEEGYDAIRIFPRHLAMYYTAPRVISTVDKLVEMAHSYGLKAGMDCEPHTAMTGREIGSRNPESTACRLVAVRGAVVNGHFTLHCPVASGTLSPRYDGIEAAFLIQGGKVTRIHDLDCTHNQELEYHDSHFTERTNGHDPHRPAVGRMYDNLAGRLAGNPSGELLLFARYQDATLIDFWASATTDYYDQLIDAYKHIPLDGIGWDEPFAECDWSHYRYGRATVDAFRRLCGYDLVDRLHHLEDGSFGMEAQRTRIDYYHTLNEGSFQAQKRFNDKARATWGKDIFTGTHHTWNGEGHINDYRAGAIDYFRLNENMEVGYADCPWYFERSMYYVYVLGSSLGRLTPLGASELNVWSNKPTVSQTDYNTRLLSMMRLNWFNIWVGDTGDTTLYPDHYSYPMCVKAMQRNQKTQAILADAKPVIDIAVWHGWEGVMGMNRADYAFAQKDFFLYSCTELFLRNIAYDFVDSRLIAEGTVKDGRLHTKLGSFRLLVLPFANVLPEAAWEKVKELSKQGGEVLFVGTPLCGSREGRNLEAEFAGLAGMKALPMETFHAYVNSTCQLPSHDSFPLEVRVPVDVDGGKPWINTENETCGSSAQGGHFHYWSEMAPRAEFANWVEAKIPQPLKVESDSVLARLYKQPDGSHLISLAALRDRTLGGRVQFGSTCLQLEGGVLAIVQIATDGTSKVLFQDGGVKANQLC